MKQTPPNSMAFIPTKTLSTDSGSRLVNLAVVGAGYWGPNIVRNLMGNAQCNLSAVCDLDRAKLEHIHSLLTPPHQVRLTQSYDELLADPSLDGIAIVTEIPSHYQLAKRALEAGKHVFVEKPLATTAEECRSLGQIAAECQRLIMVGHTFIYNNAVTRLKEIVDSGELGDIYYLHAQRVNLGRIQTHLNALWSLAVHDVAIVLYLFGETPCEVRCWGQSFITKDVEDVIFANLQFPSGRLAHLHASWLDPEKRRQVTLVGDRKMVVFDDMSLDQKIAIYDKGVEKSPLLNITHPEYIDFSGFQVLTRIGDVTMPKLQFEEPLKIEMQHFIDCIASQKYDGEMQSPITDWKQGLAVVEVLEAAQASLKQDGKTISLTGKS